MDWATAFTIVNCVWAAAWTVTTLHRQARKYRLRARELVARELLPYPDAE